MEKLTAVLLSCVGLFLVVSLVDACKCNINHPQERYCNADFSFVGTVKQIRRIDYKDMSFFEYTVKITRSAIYKGRKYLSGDRNSQPVLTPYYGSLCGRPNLVRNQKYIFSGSVEDGRLMISYCDWVQEWEKVSSVQRSYLRNGVYDDNCNSCVITGTNRMQKFDQNLHTDFVSDLQFSGLWSQRNCYYNPLASAYYRSQDCETSLSYCGFDNEAGRCLWKWTREYSKCFTERETLWQMINGARPAFTRRQQCREISIPKLKTMCLRSLIKYKKAERKLRKQARLEEENAQDTTSFLDLDLDI